MILPPNPRPAVERAIESTCLIKELTDRERERPEASDATKVAALDAGRAAQILQNRLHRLRRTLSVKETTTT